MTPRQSTTTSRTSGSSSRSNRGKTSGRSGSKRSSTTSTRGNRTKRTAGRGSKSASRTTSRTSSRSSSRSGNRSGSASRTRSTRAQRSTRKSSTSRSSRNTVRGEGVIQYMMEDHRRVEALLKRLEETEDTNERQELFEKCCGEIKLHSTLEEAIFYPAYKEAVGDSEEKRQLFFEAAEEHHAVDRLIEEMEQGDYGSEKFKAQCTLLKELIQHHVKEEHEEMFPIARRALGKGRLNEIGREWNQRREQTKSQYLAGEDEAMYAGSGEEEMEDDDGESYASATIVGSSR